MVLLLPLLGAAAASFVVSGDSDRGTISLMCYRNRAPSLITPAPTTNTSPPPDVPVVGKNVKMCVTPCVVVVDDVIPPLTCTTKPPEPPQRPSRPSWRTRGLTVPRKKTESSRRRADNGSQTRSENPELVDTAKTKSITTSDAASNVRTNIHANLHAQPCRPAAAHIRHHHNNNISSTAHCIATCPPTYPPTHPPAPTRSATTRTPPTRTPPTQGFGLTAKRIRQPHKQADKAAMI